MHMNYMYIVFICFIILIYDLLFSHCLTLCTSEFVILITWIYYVYVIIPQYKLKLTKFKSEYSVSKCFFIHVNFTFIEYLNKRLNNVIIFNL